MKCPHCTVEIHEAWTTTPLQLPHRPSNEVWRSHAMTCPACRGAIFKLTGKRQQTDANRSALIIDSIVYPQGAARPIPPGLHPALAKDYREACTVLVLSPNASAALSRRCLQFVLRDGAKIAPKSRLIDEIDELLERPATPTHIKDAVDHVRNSGNFAAHPTTDVGTPIEAGAIIDVEPHEAEYNLDVLELMFDFYYVQPARAREKRESMDARLEAAGKKPMK